MEEGINNIVLQGEICWPELKYTKSEKALYKAKLRIPVEDQRSGDSNSAYMRIVAWEEFAEYFNTLPPKSRVRISGRIQERSYVTKDGQKRATTEIIVEGVGEPESEAGENSFYLKGNIIWPEFKKVGPNESSLFKSKLVIPYTREDEPDKPRKSYVKITAWNELADDLDALGDGALIEVSGHMQERSWNAPDGTKRMFTDAVVTNFIPAVAEV
jgi:single-strand DNA-binding protein